MMGKEIFVALGVQRAERIAGFEIGSVRFGSVRLRLVCFGLVCLLKRFEASAPWVGVEARGELQCGGRGFARPIEAARVAGAQGALGIQGLTGNTGATGATGFSGATGAMGATGLAGATGAVGSAGTSGVAGAKGDAGTQGIQGLTGLTGAKGDTGTTGSQGAKGDTGGTGAQGVAGISVAKFVTLPSATLAITTGDNATSQTFFTADTDGNYTFEVIVAGVVNSSDSFNLNAEIVVGNSAITNQFAIAASANSFANKISGRQYGFTVIGAVANVSAGAIFALRITNEFPVSGGTSITFTGRALVNKVGSIG